MDQVQTYPFLVKESLSTVNKCKVVGTIKLNEEFTGAGFSESIVELNRNFIWREDTCRPPAVDANFDPNQIAVKNRFADHAFIANVRSFRLSVHIQAVCVE